MLTRWYNQFAMEFINSVEAIKNQFKGVHTMCGLSNISYGLPERKFMNRAFAIMAIAKGLDGMIVDPLDKMMMANIVTGMALAGRDAFTVNYLKAFRNKLFEF